MGCLFAMFGGLFPRLALLVVWIARPALVGAAFNTFLLPLLGHHLPPLRDTYLRDRLHARCRPRGLRLVLGDPRRPARHRPLERRLHPAEPGSRGPGRVNAQI